MQALGDDDKADIQKTIDDEVLKRQADHVPLDARCADADGDGLRVEGDLTLRGTTRAARVRRSRVAATAVQARPPPSSRRTGRSSRTRPCSARSRSSTRSRSRSTPTRRRSSAQSRVDGLRVEAALDARRQRAGAVRVERDVGDRPRLVGVAAVAADPRAVRPRRASRAARRAPCPASSCALSRIFSVARVIAAGGAVRRGRVEAVPDAEPVGVGRHDLHVERRHAELVGDELRVLRPPCRRPRWSGSAPSCRSGARAGTPRGRPRSPLLTLLLLGVVRRREALSLLVGGQRVVLLEVAERRLRPALRMRRARPAARSPGRCRSCRRSRVLLGHPARRRVALARAVPARHRDRAARYRRRARPRLRPVQPAAGRAAALVHRPHERRRRSPRPPRPGPRSCGR